MKFLTTAKTNWLKRSATLLGVTLLVSVFACQAAVATAKDFVLVEKGVSAIPIIVYKDMPARTRSAVDELADYIQRISGAKLEIIEGMPNPVPEQALWVGYQPGLEKLFPGVDFEFKHAEEILLAGNDKHLVIAGRDRWNPDGMTVTTIRNDVFENIQQEYGTVNAIYTFLESKLNVRWLWPGELGTDVPQSDTITIPPFVYRHHPVARARAGMMNYSTVLQKRVYGVSSDWLRVQRIQLDSLETPGSHPFRSWWDLYGKTNLEYFALQPDGTRGGYPSPRTVKVCMSSPAVWDRWLKDVEEDIAANPNRRIFSAADSDGWASGHCVCENCSAWDHPDGEKRLFYWKGKRENHVALSDRQLTFANTLARMLKKKYPDRDYFVAMMAYGHSRPAPIAARPDENVVIFNVSNFLGRRYATDRGSLHNETYYDQFVAWAKISPHIMWRPNTGSPAGWQQGLPDVSLNQTIKDLKFMGEHNLMGIFIDMVWEHWGTQGPMYYIMAQMLYDPSRDGHALLEDYYTRAYGPAQKPMKAYWELMDDTRTQYIAQGDETEKLTLAAFYEKPMKQAAKLFEEAKTLAAKGPKVYQQRVEFNRLGFEWSQLVLETQTLVQIVRKSKDMESPEARKIDANWVRMKEIAGNKEYQFAINAGPVQPQTPRMRGAVVEPASKR